MGYMSAAVHRRSSDVWDHMRTRTKHDCHGQPKVLIPRNVVQTEACWPPASA